MAKEKEKIKERIYKCPFCKNQINKNEKICPYCNRKIYIYKMIKLILLAIFLGLITFILIISKDVFTYTLKSTITINNTNYKITSVNSTYGEKESNWMGKPEEGYKFIIVSLSIKNNNDENIIFDPNNWYLLNEKKDIIKNIDYSNNILSLNKSEIDNLKSAAKVLIYKVNENDTKFILKYSNKNDLKNEFQIKLY